MIEAIQSSFSLVEVLNKINLIPAGGNYATLKNFIAAHKVNTSHFIGQAHNKGKTKGNGYRGPSGAPLSEILVKNNPRNSSNLRKRLISEGVFSLVCSNCDLTHWLEQPISLELDHINGDRNDQRIENLRLVCPNCHAQTPTYRGKNIKK